MKSPYGFEGLRFVEMALLLFFLPALILPVVPIAILASGRSRLAGGVLLVLSLILVVSVVAGARLGYRVDLTAFEEFAQRSKPLVAAIKTYEADHGRPPSSLEALVPRYLVQVPDTGMRMYPDYDYRVREQGDQLPDAWTLRVGVGKIFEFSDYAYYPKSGCSWGHCVEGWSYEED